MWLIVNKYLNILTQRFWDVQKDSEILKKILRLRLFFVKTARQNSFLCFRKTFNSFFIKKFIFLNYCSSKSLVWSNRIQIFGTVFFDLSCLIWVFFWVFWTCFFLSFWYFISMIFDFGRFEWNMEYMIDWLIE